MEPTIENYIELDSMIDDMHDEISCKENRNISETDLENDYIKLGRMIILKDLMEQELRKNMNKKQHRYFVNLISTREKEKSLKRRIKVMESSLDELTQTKNRLDETITAGENLIQLIDKRIAEMENQQSPY